MNNHILIPLLVLFAVKEILMGIQGLMVIRHTGTTYGAKWFGKVSTLSLYATMLAVILWTGIPKVVLYSLLGVCTFVVLLSFVLYTSHNIKILKAKN